MEHIIINPENFKANYIAYLNKCFDHWGGEKEYDWAFARQVGEQSSDIMVLKDEAGDIMAGSAVTYRKLLTPEGEAMNIGIMTGSWTLPNARGKGCFSKIITLSRELAAKRSVPFLTAFVTESNASFRRLRDAGSLLLPTSFLFSPEEPYADVEASAISLAAADPEVVRELFEKFNSSQKAFIRYAYTAEEFRLQYIDRPKKPEIIKIGREYAIVEETHNVIRALLITSQTIDSFQISIKMLTNWALQDRGKKLMLFSTQQQLAEAATTIGFSAMQGYFTILSTAASAAATQRESLLQLNIQMGDKM